MPAFIFTGPISVSTPQQNAFGVSLGLNNQNNNDANMKFNAGMGGNFGVGSVQLTAGNLVLDNLEYIDGVVNTNDVKNAPTAEF